MRDGNKPTQDGHIGAPVDGADHSEQGGTHTPSLPTEIDDQPVPPGSEPASVHVIVLESRTRIVVSGEIDADLAADLQEAAADAEATGLPIEVDAQHVTFLDSSGIAFLARLASRSAERIRVLRAPETVRFLLEVTRIGELLDLVDTDDPEPAEPGAPTLGLAPSAAGPDDAA